MMIMIAVIVIVLITNGSNSYRNNDSLRRLANERIDARAAVMARSREGEKGSAGRGWGQIA